MFAILFDCLMQPYTATIYCYFAHCKNANCGYYYYQLLSPYYFSSLLAIVLLFSQCCVHPSQLVAKRQSVCFEGSFARLSLWRRWLWDTSGATASTNNTTTTASHALEDLEVNSGTVKSECVQGSSTHPVMIGIILRITVSDWGTSNRYITYVDRFVHAHAKINSGLSLSHKMFSRTSPRSVLGQDVQDTIWATILSQLQNWTDCLGSLAALDLKQPALFGVQGRSLSRMMVYPITGRMIHQPSWKSTPQEKKDGIHPGR